MATETLLNGRETYWYVGGGAVCRGTYGFVGVYGSLYGIGQCVGP